MASVDLSDSGLPQTFKVFKRKTKRCLWTPIKLRAVKRSVLVSVRWSCLRVAHVLTFFDSFLSSISQSIQFPHIQCTIQWFLLYPQICAIVTGQSWNIPITSKRSSVPSNCRPGFSPQPQPLIYFLSSWIFLFWTLIWVNHTLCGLLWLHSLSMFSKFIQVEAVQYFIPFYGHIMFHLWLYIVLFILSSIDGYLDCFHLLDYYE